MDPNGFIVSNWDTDIFEEWDSIYDITEFRLLNERYIGLELMSSNSDGCKNYIEPFLSFATLYKYLYKV